MFCDIYSDISGKSQCARKRRVYRTSRRPKDENAQELLDAANKRNAFMAKLNRLKKKAYVQNLESQLERSNLRFAKLQREKTVAEQKVDELQAEVLRLQSLLQNDTREKAFRISIDHNYSVS